MLPFPAQCNLRQLHDPLLCGFRVALPPCIAPSSSFWDVPCSLHLPTSDLGVALFLPCQSVPCFTVPSACSGRPYAGLYLPTSDLDAVVIGSGCTDIPQGLKALAQSLLRKKLAKNMQVRPSTEWVRVYNPVLNSLC